MVREADTKMNRAIGRPLPGTVGDRLRQTRRRRFVGRSAEVELFRSVMAGDAPHTVLFVHGPGGIGKSALLAECAEVAGDVGVQAVRVDVQALGASPPAFLAGLTSAMGLPETETALDEIHRGGRWALLLDTHEPGAPFDTWLRDRFLSLLPADVVVVVASRLPPSPDWVADPGWRELLRVVSLRNLGPEDVRAYLRSEGLEADLYDRVIELTHGHPLALSLFADVLAQRGEPSTANPLPELAAAPEVVRLLLERFVEGVPSSRHRQALHVCAHARFTTEALLRHVVGENDGGRMFSWLRELSFVEQGPLGLYPHDLARDVLEADLRWRDGAGYAELHRQVRGHAVRRAQDTQGPDQQRACTDVIFLHRTNPVLAALGDWATLGLAYAEALSPSDRAPILAMAERHEGRESAVLVEHWMRCQPQAFGVFRASGEEPIGFAALLALHQAGEQQLAADPGTAAMWAYAVRHGPPAPGEAVMAIRFLVDAEAYQGPSPSLNLMCVRGVQHVLAGNRLAWSFVGAFSDPEAVTPMFATLDYHRAVEADYGVGERRYGVFAHDFRRVTPEAWLELTARYEVEDVGPPPDPATRPTAVLSQPEFAEAVRSALRDLHRPDRLARSPLLTSRLVHEGGEGEAPVEVLSRLVFDAARALGSHPRDEKLFRALDRTYLRPAPSQEKAAEVLGLPFSTYRRHLTQGVERTVDQLWKKELYGSS